MMLEGFEWYEEGLPWEGFNDLDEQMDKQPTFIVCEWIFVFLGLISFFHAAKNGKRYMVVWFGALIGGCANDVVFMVLPFVDNFWHAQAIVMLTPRLPFYILFVYVGFIYVAVIATWRIHWAPGTTGALGRAAASGITGMLFYAPFDLAGAKFLWWSWHDSDAAVDARWCGVPVGSTMWTLVHGFCFHMLVYWCGCYEPLAIPTNVLKKANKKRIKRAANEKVKGGRKGGKKKTDKAYAAALEAAEAETTLLVQTPTEPLSALKFLWALLVVSVLGTPFMMVAMFPFQLHQLELDWSAMAVTQQPGRPDYFSFFFSVALFSTLAYRGLKHAPCPNRTFRDMTEIDLRLFGCSVFYLIALMLCLAFGVPEDVRATGVHQTYGDCGVKDVDLSGYPRTKYVCKEDYDEDFTFDCVQQQLPHQKHPSWYTLCGRGWKDDPIFEQFDPPFKGEKFAIYMGVQVLISFSCFVLLTLMYIPGDPTKAEVKAHLKSIKKEGDATTAATKEGKKSK